MRLALLTTAGAGALVLVACARDRTSDDVATGRTVADTVGDTVVVRTVGATDSVARLRLVPELRIGELEGADEYTFGGIGALAPAPAGGVYVWDRTATALRQYDSSGAFVRQIARRGQGPGEYEEANGMVVLRDGRLVLWDPRNARLNLYDSAGAPAGSWQSPSNLFTSQTGMYADTADNVYVLLWLRGDGPAGRAAPPMALVRLAPDGTVGDTLHPPLPEVPDASLMATNGGMTVYERVPYMPGTSWSFTPDGEFVTGQGGRYALTVHRAAGPLRIERDVAPVPVQPAEADDARESVTGRLRRADPGWSWSGPDVPDVKPFFSALRTDADGRIWVQRVLPGERIPDEEYAELTDAQAQRPIRPPLPPPRRWREPVAFDVFAADGRFLGFLPVPPRTTLHHTRGDVAWGVERDSLDVPYVLRFRIEPSLLTRERRP